MRVILGSAAVVGACAPDKGAVVAKQTGDPKADPPLTDSATASARSVDTAPRPPQPDPGYTVVDMLPTPSRCSVEAAQGLKATASFSSSKKNELVMVITPLPQGLRDEDVANIQLSGASDKGQIKVTPSSLEIRTVVGAAGNKFLSVVVPLRCSDETGSLHFQTQWEQQGTQPNQILPVVIEAAQF